MCIPNGNCCTAADCPLTLRASATQCLSGACRVAACQSGSVDVNSAYSDGCECLDSPTAKTCGAATALGTLGIGASLNRTGVLPLAGGENWFVVTFTGNGSTSYHPRIQISASGGDALRFDVLTSCAGGGLPCSVEGGSSTNRTIWEVQYANGSPSGIGCGSATTPCNSTCVCTSPFQPIPPVGNNGTVFIRVFRASGAVTCNAYTLTVAN